MEDSRENDLGNIRLLGFNRTPCHFLNELIHDMSFATLRESCLPLPISLGQSEV